ncbi:hypothetical protein EBR57_10820, partial [bacterium]|nr:hypothetical protein [bacterium]
LYGTAALSRFRTAHVMVVGIGGVGSWVVEALARSGIGRLTLVDLDEVCVSNINRQLHALDSTVGRPKVEVMVERVRAISPEARVEGRVEFFTADTASRLLGLETGSISEGRPDFVVDAIDAMSTLPDEIKTIIKDLANAAPKTDADLTTESKKLAVASRTLVEILNRTPGESESVEAEINLQVVTFGVFQLLENYGYKPAVGDLVQTWKTLDMRTNAYQTLIDGLIDFIKKHACALKALKSDDTINTDVTYKKVTWEMQYSLWEELSVYGNTVRTQPLIKAFNENNQMASAKVDFDGEKIDSLIDPISPE